MTDRRALERTVHRLDILSRQLEHVGLAGVVVLTEADPDGRAALRRSAERAAARAGLDGVLNDARRRFRAWVEGAFSRSRSDLEVIQFTRGAMLGTVTDRIDVYMAVDDAVLGTVARESISEADRRALLEPFERMMGSITRRAQSRER